MAIAVTLLRCGDVTRAQRRYIDGVFAATPQGPIELIAYAEANATGILRLAYGSMEDIPTLHPGCRVLVSVPAWRPVAAVPGARQIAGMSRYYPLRIEASAPAASEVGRKLCNPS